MRGPLRASAALAPARPRFRGSQLVALHFRPAPVFALLRAATAAAALDAEFLPARRCLQISRLRVIARVEVFPHHVAARCRLQLHSSFFVRHLHFFAISVGLSRGPTAAAGPARAALGRSAGGRRPQVCALHTASAHSPATHALAPGAATLHHARAGLHCRPTRTST